MTLTVEQAAEHAEDSGRTYTLTKVEQYGDGDFTLSADGTGFGLDGKYGVAPKVGDVVTLYTHQGSLIHGLDLNGEPIYYRTRAEVDEDRRKETERAQRERDAEFEEQREQRDAAFDALPPIFKRRIIWFRRHNPRFRQDFEPYEMSACVDAVKLAEWAEARDDPGEAIQRFRELSYEKQKETVPGLAYDQHSGNSFGFAVRLAYHFVTVPENVYQEHGAMVPLVGCIDYGCIHPREEIES